MTETEETKSRLYIRKFAVEYKPLGVLDALDVAQLHTVAFPRYFLTELGTEFVRRYYEELIELNKLSVKVYIDGQLMGFIVGGSNIGLAQSQFYRKNFQFCCYSIGIALLRSSIVRRGIFARFTHIVAALRSKIKSRAKNKGVFLPHHKSDFRLLSITVAPQFRGRGVAKDMLNEFNKKLVVQKIESYGLSVKKENKKAVLFYKKAGMVVEKETKDSIYFRKKLTGKQ